MTTGGDGARDDGPRALVAGWFSFPYHHATAGDLMACDVVCEWLAEAGLPYDVALGAPFEGGVDWMTVPRDAYSHLVFVCGPVGPSRAAVVELLERFDRQRRIAVNVTMQEPIEAWNPFDAVVERDSDAVSRPDLSFASETALVPVVGLVLVEPYQPEEFPGRDAQRAASDAIRRLLHEHDVAAIPIDTRVDANAGELRTPREVEAAIARMDAVVTTRLHGMVLSLKNGVPALAIDPVAGGSKIRRQAERIGWPAVHTLDTLTPEELGRSLAFCLSAEARQLAVECGRRARADLAATTRDELVAALQLDVDPPQGDDTFGRGRDALAERPQDAPVTVVVVASGDAGRLEACLESLAACAPRPRQTIVAAAESTPASAVPAGVEVVRAATRGASLNAALARAASPTVMLVHDDCLVSTQWVGVGRKHAIRSPASLGWGQVLPLEDSRRVPSSLHAPRFRLVPSSLTWAHTHAGIMVCPRDDVLRAGGFAEKDRLDVDLELAHRWESTGRRTVFVRDLVVWRSPWRDERQLARLAVEQAEARGAFYGTLLRNGDRGAAVAAIAKEWGAGLRGMAAGIRHRRPAWSDPRRGILRGLPRGVVRGLTAARPRPR